MATIDWQATQGSVKSTIRKYMYTEHS